MHINRCLFKKQVKILVLDGDTDIIKLYLIIYLIISICVINMAN